MAFVDFNKLRENTPKAIAMRTIVITIGCIINSVGLSFFLDPSKLVSGGFSGVAMLLSRLIPLNTGIIAIILNIPLFIIGLKVFGKRFLFNTIFATLLYSLLVFLLENTCKSFLPLTSNVLLSSILGGVVTATGLAIIFRCGATTGGTDIIVRLMRLKIGDLSFGTMFMVMDMTILLVQLIVFKNIELTLYSALAIAIENFTFDKILYGFDEAKILYIISDHHDEIKEAALVKLDAGVTILDATGGYSGDAKKVLLIAVKKHNYVKLKNIVQKIDPKAFFIVSSANEIFGEGFKNNDKKDI